MLALCLAVAASVQAGDDGGAFLEKAQSLYAGGELKGAVIELKNALQKNPSLAQARRLLGRIYLDVRDGPSAEKELRRAQALGLEGADLRLDLAEAFLLQGRFSEVEEQVKGDLEGAPAVKARALMLQGLAQAGGKQLEAARKSLELALESDPDAHRARLGLAQLELVQGHPEEAQAQVDALLARDPDYADALLMSAELDRKAGRLEEAVTGFGKVLGQSPKDVRALLGRATVLIALQRNDAAVADLDRADEIKPGLVMSEYLRGLLAFREKAFDQAREHLQKVLSASPDHLPSQVMMGVISYLRGELQIAEEYLGKVVGAMPDNLALVKLLAATRIKQKEARRAIAILEPAAHAHPGEAQLLALLGSAYMLDGDHTKGAEAMQRAVEIEPNLATLRTQLALGLLAEGETDAALTQLQDAVELEQGVVQADVLLVLAHLKKKQFDQALKVAAEMERRMADSPIPYNLSGLAYLAKGDKRAATERFNKALEVDPGFLTAEANLARIDLSNKDLDAAERRFRKMLERDASYVGTYLGLAAVAERRKDYDAMVRWLERGQEKNRDSAKPGLLLVNHYLRNDQPLKALAVSNDLFSRFPDAAPVLEALGRSQLAAGEVASAVTTLQRLVKQRPLLQSYLLLAGAQAKNEDLTGTRRSLKKALELDPESLSARLTMGLLELKTDHPDAALEIAAEIQKSRPREVAGYVLEARAQAMKKAPEKAVAAFEKAYGLKKSAAVATALSEGYRELGRSQDAVAILEDWRQAQPDDLRTRLQLALLYQGLGRKSDAIREYESLYPSSADNVLLLNNLAWLYLEAGNRRAIELAAQAYEKSPERAEIVDTYGWVLLQLGDDPERALTLLQQAYVAYPTNQDIGYHVASALHRQGRSDEARRTLKRVLKEGTGFSEAEAAGALAKELGL